MNVCRYVQLGICVEFSVISPSEFFILDNLYNAILLHGVL